MNAAVALRMVGADFLKLRKKRGTVIWALVLALAPLVIFFIVRAASTPPPGRTPGGRRRRTATQTRCGCWPLFFGPLAAIMIGTDAGAGDLAPGVFRDLVVTGRSRVALFASRVPAALGLCWLVVLVGYALVLIGTFAFASGTRRRARRCSLTVSASRCSPPASCAPSRSASPRLPDLARRR